GSYAASSPRPTLTSDGRHEEDDHAVAEAAGGGTTGGSIDFDSFPSSEGMLLDGSSKMLTKTRSVTSSSALSRTGTGAS
ncbi:unnamed protein product, partial [Amoebophrya sp. A25]